MPDRTQDLKNHRQVTVACKNYTDSEIKKSEERILSIVARNNVSYIDHTDEATYRFTAPANAKLLMLQSVGGNSVKYAPTTVSDTTTAYQKNVPSYSPSIDRASASMNILGGMSYKYNQLIRNDNFSDGVTGWSSGNGSLSISNNIATITANVGSEGNFRLQQTLSTVAITGHKMLVSFIAKKDYEGSIPLRLRYPAQSNTVSLTNTFANYSILVEITETTNLDTFWLQSVNAQTGAVFSVSLVNFFDLTDMNIDSTSVDTAIAGLMARGINPYEPNTYDSGSIRDTAPTSVKSVGSNLFNNTTNYSNANANGVSITITGNECVLNGTSNNGFYNVLSTFTLPAGTYHFKNYILSGSMEGDLNRVRFGLYEAYDSDLALSYNERTFTLSQTTTVSIVVWFGDSGITFNNCKLVYMLNYGSTALPYKEYVGTIDTLSIPAQVQALDGYGWGIDIDYCYNYIDFNAKKFIKKANKYTFTGNESCGKVAGTTPLYNIRLEGAKNDDSNALLTSTKWHMSFVSASSTVGTYGVEIQGNTIYFQPPSDVITTEAQLLADITGLTIEYELATPVETDISAYLTTNEIEIEPNGTLSFESTYSAYVPSNVSYNGVIKHALATAIKQEGANLLDITQYNLQHSDRGTSVSISGNTLNVITSNATNGVYIAYNFESGKTYTLSLTTNEIITNLYLFTTNDTSESGGQLITYDVTTGNYTFTPNENKNYLRLWFSANKTFNVSNIMLNIGSTALSYRPHKATVTRALPYQASDGWSAGSVRNVRVFSDDEGNVVSKRETNVGNQDLGDLNYSILSSTDFPNYFVSSAITGLKSQTTNILNPIYAVNNTAYTNMNNMQIRVETNSVITARNDNFNNSTIFKSAMSGVSLFYELDDEHKTESDMDDFDYFFDCEEGDTFTLVNTEQLQCYATYSFLIKEAKSNE